MKKLKTLAELRCKKNMSQRKLAEKLNISCASIGMYESGKRVPSLNRAIEIARLFDVPVEEISFSNIDKEKRKKHRPIC